MEVTVNGQGPFRFAIDTGAQGKARADSRLVEKLKLPVVGEARGGDPSGKNPVTVNIVRIDTIGIGGLSFAEVDAPSRDYNRGAADGIDGILGLGLFSGHLLTLDYAHKKVIIETGELAASAPGVVKFSAPRGIPIVPISVAGQTIAAHIDTGNLVAAFIFPTDFATNLPFQSELIVLGNARTVNNVYEIKGATLAGDVSLGTLTFRKPEVRYPSPGREANIGSLALADKSVTIDQKNGLVRITD